MTFGKVEKRVHELEKKLTEQNKEIMEKSILNSTSDLSNYNTLTNNLNITNNRLSSLSTQVQILAQQNERLLCTQETKNSGNDNTIASDETKKHTINCDLLLLFDSNGKSIKENQMDKESTCQKLWTPKLENVAEVIENSDIRKIPNKVLLNVGLNNVDHDNPGEIIKKGELVLKLIRERMPTSTIYINSILFRKDDQFKDVIQEVNEHFIKFSRQAENVIFINNSNITNEHMLNTKHLNKSGFFTFITNIKYILFGYLPKFRARDDQYQKNRHRPRYNNNKKNYYNNQDTYREYDRQFNEWDRN